jgi:hypothetical protein
MSAAANESPFWLWLGRFADILALGGIPALLYYGRRLWKRMFRRLSFETRILSLKSGFKGLICCVSAQVGAKMSAEELEQLVDSSQWLEPPLKNSPIGAILKAIEHHRPVLRHCWFIVSEASESYFKVLKKACAKFFPAVTLHEPERVIDVYHKVDDVYNATHRIFNRCGPETDGELSAKDVITDVTSGTTVMSIAVAMACLDDDRRIEYIEQKDRKDIYEIDVSWEKITRRPAKTAADAPEVP